MSDQRNKILENQVDVLAGKVATLELQMGVLVKALTRESASERVGLTLADAANLKHPIRAIGADSNHRWERDDRARTAEREDEIEAMLAERRNAARLEELIGPEKASARAPKTRRS